MLGADFDVTLHDPDRPTLQNALDKAANEASALTMEMESYFDWPPADLATVLARVETETEGVARWRGQDSMGRGVDLAWRTTEAGYRLVRVIGFRYQFHTFQGADNAVADGMRPWPSASIVYQEWAYFYQRHPGAALELVLACDCGALGRPADIGWRDTRCGPCHDRWSEGVPLPESLRRQFRNLNPLGAGQAVSATPDGSLIVGWDGNYPDNRVLLYADRSGTIWGSIRIGVRLRCVAWNARGHRLGILCYTPEGSRILLHTFPELQPVAAVELPGDPLALALNPEGNRLYASTQSAGLVRIDLDGTTAPRPILDEQVSTLAVSPDGRWLAGLGAGSQVLLVNLRTAKVRRRCHVEPPAWGLDFTPDGRTLVVVRQGQLLFLAVPSLEQRGSFWTPMPSSEAVALRDAWLLIFAGVSVPSLLLPWRLLLQFAEDQ